MNKQNVLISLLAIACLVSCNGGGGGKQSGSKIVIDDFGTVKMEAENFNVANWQPAESYEGASIIEENAASGGKYLAAAEAGSNAEAKFTFELKKDSRVVISAAYAQMEADIASKIDMSKVYHWSISNVSPLAFASGKETLKARSSATSWELMPYLYQDLDKGIEAISIDVTSFNRITLNVCEVRE